MDNPHFDFIRNSNLGKDYAKKTYQYNGKFPTIVPLEHNWKKVEIQPWETFESTCNPTIFATNFVEVITETRWELIKKYMTSHAWKRPSPKWTNDEILSKI